MQNYRLAKLLRSHFTERDRYQSKPLYEAIIEKCMELGDTGRIHRTHILTHDLPVAVQIIQKGANSENG
jgi:PII-like signaling protein